MKKKLMLDELQVESFEVNPSAFDSEGTVRAHFDGGSVPVTHCDSVCVSHCASACPTPPCASCDETQCWSDCPTCDAACGGAGPVGL